MTREFQIETVSRARFDEAVAVLCDAFYDYPVMRFVAGVPDGAAGDELGALGADYSARLTALVGFFTVVRFLRDDLVLAVCEEGRFVGVSAVNRPSDAPLLDSGLARDAPWKPEPAGEVEDQRRALWRDLGDFARRRYEAYGEATADFAYPEPHYHLGMIGVLRSHGGSGLGRMMLDHVHDLSRAHPSSVGVSLTTEHPGNVPLYQHFGYREVGHEQVGDLETWGLFRRDAS